MDVYPTDLQDPSAQVIDPGEHATDPGGRGTVSRAWVVLALILAKILTGVNAAFQSGLVSVKDRQKARIERTVPSQAYGVG